MSPRRVFRERELGCRRDLDVTDVSTGERRFGASISRRWIKTPESRGLSMVNFPPLPASLPMAPIEGPNCPGRPNASVFCST